MARASSKIVKAIPNTDSGRGVVCYTKPEKTGDKYIVSHNPTKMHFTLWKCIEDGYEKIATGKNPYDLYELIPYDA